jgi:hypothetical protein
MSKAQLERFAESVSDPAAFDEATGGAGDLQQCARNVVQYATARGYELTEDEARTWLAERTQQVAGGELEESQLDAVAGGIVIIGSRAARAGGNAALSSAIKAGWGQPPDDGKAGWANPPDDGKTL